MSMFDEKQNKPAEYRFASAGLDEFQREFSIPKQHQEIVEDFSELEPIEEEAEDTGLPNKLQASAGVANASASILTVALDSTLSGVLAFIANDKPETFKADESQKEELQEAFSAYVKLKGGDIPPGTALLMLILSIYGSKAVAAFQLRKANNRAEEADREIARLRAKLELAEKKGKTEGRND